MVEGKKMIYVIAAANLDSSVNMDTACELAEMAKEAGADAIKFRAAMTGEEWGKLKEFCDATKIDFLSTPKDSETAAFLYGLDMKKFRIDSSDITNHELLEFVASLGSEMIISTGMCTLYEISEAVRAIRKTPVTLLHCVSEYPTLIQNVNLRMIESLQMLFDKPVGFSDHTVSTLVPALAVVAGAEVVEKHFGLATDNPSEASKKRLELTPQELAEMVTNVRTAEVMMGSPIKKITEIEREVRRGAGK